MFPATAPPPAAAAASPHRQHTHDMNLSSSATPVSPHRLHVADPHDMNVSLLKQLECPVCYETCLPPIYMCLNGHNICNSCRDQLQECVICRLPGPPAGRNRFAEDISSKVKLPCPNKTDGCTQQYNLNELEVHLQSCESSFKYTCVLDELTNDTSITDYCVVWHGSRANLVGHVRQHHQACYSEQATTEILRWIGPARYKHTDIRLIAVFGELFWVMLFTDRSSGVEVVPYYIGGKGNEKKYECKMEVNSIDGEFRLMCVAPVFNWASNVADKMADKMADKVAQSKILRLKDELLAAVLEKDMLTVKVTIMKK